MGGSLLRRLHRGGRPDPHPCLGRHRAVTVVPDHDRGRHALQPAGGRHDRDHRLIGRPRAPPGDPVPPCHVEPVPDGARDRGGELGLPPAHGRDRPMVDPRTRRLGSHGRCLRAQRDHGGSARRPPARPHGAAGPPEDAWLTAGRVPALLHRTGALRGRHRALLHRGGRVVGGRVPRAARLRPPDVLPEPDDGRPSRGTERTPDGAGPAFGEPPAEGKRDGRPAQGVEPDEGRVRRGRLARAPGPRSRR